MAAVAVELVTGSGLDLEGEEEGEDEEEVFCLTVLRREPIG